MEIFTEAGFKTKKMDKSIIFQWADLWFNADYVGPLNPQSHIEKLNKFDAIKDVPEDWVMAARVRMLLGGLAFHLGMSFKVAEIWKPFAEEALANARNHR